MKQSSIQRNQSSVQEVLALDQQAQQELQKPLQEVRKNRRHNHVLVPVDQDMISLMISVNHQQDRSIEPIVDLGHKVDRPARRKKFDLTRNEISSIMIDSLKVMDLIPMKTMSKLSKKRTTAGKLEWIIFCLQLDSHS